MTPYDKITGRLGSEEAPTKIEVDPKIALMRADWLRHPTTLEFLHTLTEEYNKIAQLLVECASSGGELDVLHRLGAKAKKLKEIIDYARRD